MHLLFDAYDYSMKYKSSKKCMGDTVYKKWDVYWTTKFDGTIDCFIAFNG